jgi:hypothetical protein
MESALDRLASAERASARAGLENRLFGASRGALAQSTDAPATLRFPAAGRWRLAAVVALLAGAGVLATAWLTTRPVTVAPPPNQVATEIPKASDEPIDADDLRGELEDLLASYDEVESADLADASPTSGTFWAENEGLTTEDPIR